MKLKQAVVALFALGMASVALASTTIYDASTPRVDPNAASGLAYFYNPGPDNGGQSGHILFDDVTAQSSLPQTLFNVTQVTFTITRQAGAPAVQITPYFAQLFQDAQQFGGPGDGPNFDPLSPTQMVNVPLNLSPNAGTVTTQTQVSFGDGVSTLFNVIGANASTDASYRSFGIGLKFSTSHTGPQNGWTVGTNANNLDVLWDYASNDNFSEFTFGSDQNGLIIGTMAVKIQGNLLSGVAGDANADGKVDVTDLGIFASHWQQAGDFPEGDFNYDGFIDVTDLGILASNWQVGVSPSSPSAMSFQQALASVGLGGVFVPEPATLTLFSLSLMGLAARRRR